MLNNSNSNSDNNDIDMNEQKNNQKIGRAHV